MTFNCIDLIPPKTQHTKIVANIKDVYLKAKIEVLLNNWCVQKTNNEYVFFKHFNSNRKGVINQLILSGNDYDGIYELEIFGHNLKMHNVFDKTINDLVIKIESSSNYDLATFNKKNNKITILRRNHTEESFWNEIARYISRLSIFDIINIVLENETVAIDQQQLGELKFRKKTHEYLKKYKEQIKSVQFVQKKKHYYISRLDLGEEGFRNELLKRNLITNEEYNIFTTQNKDICSKIYKHMKKIEIL
jgi:hypothetical protein